MKLPEMCVSCLYNNHKKKTSDERYINRVKEIIDNREEDDCAPFLAFKFKVVYEELFGKSDSIAGEKRRFNNLVLNIEDSIREKIEKASDPLLTSLMYARVGNYIDFATIDEVNDEDFLELLSKATISENDKKTYSSFVNQCSNANTFLLICDNCGEIVLDKLFVEQMKKRFPNLKCQAMVRGGEVQNDVTIDDAIQSGMDKVAEIVDNGMAIAGCVYNRMPEANKKIISDADVVLAKGQGNYESLCGNGIHIFYSFLCKCDYFTEKFKVKKLTGMFVEESE